MLSIHTGFVPISHTYRTSVLLHLAHLLQIFGPTAENMCPNIWLTSYKYLAQKLKIQAEIIPAMCKNLHSCCHICTQKQTVNLYLSSANPGAFWHTNSGKMVMVMMIVMVMVMVTIIMLMTLLRRIIMVLMLRTIAINDDDLQGWTKAMLIVQLMMMIMMICRVDKLQKLQCLWCDWWWWFAGSPLWEVGETLHPRCLPHLS